MDNLTYLEHIAQSNRPVKKRSTNSGAFNSLIIKIIIGGIVLFFLLMAIGAMLSNLGNRSRDLADQVYIRSNNLNSAVQTYTRDLKSSRLRAASYSLSGVLTNYTNQLHTYLSKSTDEDEKLTFDAKITQSEAAIQQDLEISLSNAKLNGILDRTYDTQIKLQVSLLLSLLSQLIERSSDDAELLKIIQPFHSSLEAIQTNLNSHDGPVK